MLGALAVAGVVGLSWYAFKAHGWLVEASIASIGRPTTVYALTEGARHG